MSACRWLSEDDKYVLSEDDQYVLDEVNVECIYTSQLRRGRIKWQRNVRDDQDISEIIEVLLISRVMDL